MGLDDILKMFQSQNSESASVGFHGNFVASQRNESRDFAYMSVTGFPESN